MQWLNYHHLHYFWTVCEEGSFTRAAEKLRLSQSTVSAQVAQLEETLGQKLMSRTTRGFELTEAGKAAHEYATAIFETGQELLNFMSHRPTARSAQVRIGALGSLSRNVQLKFVEPLLGRESARFTVTIGDARRLLRLLKEHALDVVLSTFPAGEADAGSVYTHTLVESPLCLVAKPRSGFKRAAPQDVLESAPVFLPSAAHEGRADFDHWIETKKIRLNVAGEVDDVALLRLLALTGQGVALAPRLGVESDVRERRLIVLHEFKALRQRFYAITRQKRFPNPVVAELVQRFK